jgi:multiple sugar transport system substrate-binding protein
MKAIMRWITILLALSFVLSAAACGGGAAPTQAPQQPAATEKPAEPKPAETKAMEPVTIHMLAMEQAGPTVEEMNTIADEFNKTNPNVKVQIDYVAYDALHDKITTALASTPPAYDIFLVDDIWYAEFADKGYLLEATDRVTPEMKSGIFEAAWEISTVNGKVYGMPWLLDQKYFYYNEDLLKQAGFNAPPKTWEELIDQAKVMKEKGIVEYPIVWSWGQYEAAICDWVTLLYGNGGTLVDESGKPTFNNEVGVKTLEWMLKTVDDGITNPSSISYVEEDVRNVFSQGKAAFALNWNYMFDLANFQADQSQITGKVKMSLMPAFKDGGVESSTIDGSMGMSVAATSANADAAWAYVEYLTSKDVQDRYSSHMLPMWETSFEGEAGKKLASTSEVTAVTVPMFQAQFPYSHVRPKVPFYPEASKALQLALQKALTKQASPADALNEAAATWEKLMK